jgi:hypothetical protein
MVQGAIRVWRPGPVTWLVAGVALAAAVPEARAGLIAVEASDVATVQPAGPRPGTFGKIFFNIEGQNNGVNGAFASFGVADFQFPSLGPVALTGPTITLTLTQSNAAFTHDGGLDFFLATDVTTNIQPGTSPLSFIRGAPGTPDGIDAQLGTLFPLGSGTFTQTASGDIDTFTLTLSAAAQAFLAGQLNGDGRVRLVIGPADGDVAATAAGLGNSDGPAPTLLINVSAVPEPSTLALVVLGGVALAGWRRLRRPAR